MSIQPLKTTSCSVFLLCADSNGFKCTWNIDNSRNLMTYEFFEIEEKLNLSIQVPSFWNVRLYPYGTDNGDTRMTLVVKYLPSISHHQDLMAILRFQFIDESGAVMYSSKPGQLHEFHSSSRYTSTLKADSFPEEVFMFIESHPRFSILIEGAGWGTGLVDINTVRSRLQTKLEEIRNMEKFFDTERDITFRVTDGEEVGLTVDRLLRKCASLRVYTEKGAKFGTLKPLTLSGFTDDDLKPPILREFLHFIRTESVTHNFSNVVEGLFHIAVCFQVPDLKRLCENKMLQSICFENAAEYFLLAFKHAEEKLQLHAADFIFKNSVYVLRSDGWWDLEGTHDALVALTRIILCRRYVDFNEEAFGDTVTHEKVE